MSKEATVRSAMKLALEALDNLMYWDNGKSDYDQARKAITALREALAEQPAQQQEPEWYHFVRYGEDCFVPYSGQAPAIATPLYTSPPAQRKPLTDEEIRDLWSWSMTAEAERTVNTQQHAFARAIEAAHNIKENT